MYSKNKLIDKMSQSSNVKRSVVIRMYDSLIEEMEVELREKGKFVLYPLGEVVLKRKEGNSFSPLHFYHHSVQR